MSDICRPVASRCCNGRVKLVGICGRSRVGKSTSAAIFARWGYRRVAFAAALKDVISRVFAGGKPMTEEMKGEICPLPVEVRGVEKMVTYGRLMQLVGQGMRTALGGNVWVRTLFDYDVLPALSAGQPVVVEDVRFPQEAAAIWMAGGIVIRVTRRIGPAYSEGSSRPDILPDGRDSREEDVTDLIQVDAEVLNEGTMEELESGLARALKSPRKVLH